MTPDLTRNRLETEAIILGYAMSRLDGRYLQYRGVRTWRSAFEEVSEALTIRSSSIKNLRDEFDPVHCNQRRGWHQRPLRPNRQRVLDDLKDVSDDALMALVDRIIARDEEATVEAVDSLAAIPRTAHNVAERLLTGRRAEDYFLAHSQSLIGIASDELVDRRQAACGYDFGVTRRPEVGIEIKGLKPIAGELLFTDREWSEASIRLENYWLVVIGNLNSKPRGKVLLNPHRNLPATCSYQVTVAAVWRSKFSVAS
ncbi:MAG: protein NO VEIN domain-containing protein [Gemmataceae bacterium]